jgi:hypothetical protein
MGVRSVAVHMRPAGMAVRGARHRKLEGVGIVTEVLHHALRDRDEQKSHRHELLLIREREVRIEERPLTLESRLDRSGHRRGGSIVEFSGVKHAISAGLYPG